jgi:hypothetical protein
MFLAMKWPASRKVRIVTSGLADGMPEVRRQPL